MIVSEEQATFAVVPFDKKRNFARSRTTHSPMRISGVVLLFIICTSASFALDEAAYKSAVDLYGKGRPLEAQKAFEALAVANPDNSSIQFYLGRLALQRNDHTQAVQYLERAASLSPGDSRIHLRLGDAYGISAQKAGLFSQLDWARKCREEYEKAVELDPKNIDAHWSLMEYCRQAPSIAGGGLDKALVQAQEIKKLDPARGRLALGDIYTADKKFDLAFNEFDEVLKVEPANYEALFQTGRLAVISGERLEQGLAALRRCLTQVPRPGQPPLAAVHGRIGNILEKQGNKPGARAAYETALTIDHKFSQASESLRRL
jgi:tetratricopeptide (TPR) repeat protein